MIDQPNVSQRQIKQQVAIPLSKGGRPRSAYIHIPFCNRKCGYCNFTVVAGRDDLIGAYLTALERELTAVLREPHEVDTLFLGGGTPTHLPLPALDRLFDLIDRWLPRSPTAEFSCEANPTDCSEVMADRLAAAGVNRLSIGGQSFSTRKLQALEREHTPAQLREAIEIAKKYFPNTSLDLIFAAPDETLDQWHSDLHTALTSGVQHLSTYGLTIERGAAFFGRRQRGLLREVDESSQLAMYEYAIDTLTAAGWEHYEVSNFCRPGYRCRHNEAYWSGRFWWGFGAGAASFLPSEDRLGTTIGCRRTNHRSTFTYIRRLQSGKCWFEEEEPIDKEQYIRERLVFGLRRLEGVDLTELAAVWGEPVEQLFSPHLDRFIEAGMLERDADRVRLTRRGLVISDSLWPPLLDGQA